MPDSEYIVPRGINWHTTGKVPPTKEVIDRVFAEVDKIKPKETK